MNELLILEKIETTSSKKEKQSLLLSLKDSDFLKMRDLLDATFNFKRKFYIKKFNVDSFALNDICLHEDFIKLLKVLESQNERGDQAKNSVEMFFKKCNKLQQKWYERIIKKDLKAGFSISTTNDCKFNIPEFEVMLAKDGKQCKQLDKLISEGGFVSKKFDGYRCLAEIENGNVTLYSRNGTVYTNFPKIEEALSKSFPVGSFVFDGEIMSDDFQSMQKTAFASDDISVGDVNYFIFDYIPADEWNKANFKMKKAERNSLLKEVFSTVSSVESLPLKIVEQKWVSSLKEIQELERNFISEGFEGAMFLPNIPYYLGKKSNKMLKFKTMLSQEVEIVGFYLGEKGSKYEDILGGVNIKQEDGLICDCGSGFSDADRTHIWNNQKDFIGRIFEAAYQEVGSNGKLRFPVFKRWRNDKSKN